MARKMLRFTVDTLDEIAEWIGDVHILPAEKPVLRFKNKENWLIAHLGDWIIKDQDGFSVRQKPLPEYFDEFSTVLKDQVVADNHRWNVTWRERGVEGQELRFIEWVDEKHKQFLLGEPFPWVKVAVEAMIGYVREKYLEAK